MKFIFYLPIAFCLISVNLTAQENIKRIEISENWTFHRVGTNKWYDATVPGCVHTDLLDNGLIRDPYFRDNETSLQWIDKNAWEYKTTFFADESLLNREHVELDFKGLDTYAEVTLNGKHLLTTDNMFREYRVEISDILANGENTLRILFHSPVVMANTGVKSNTMVQEIVMMLSFFPSWVVTRTTGPDSIRVNALLSFI